MSPVKTMPASLASSRRPFWLATARLFLLAACFVVASGFGACDDDPLLDSGGGTGCAGSHCGARILPDDSPNPAVF